MLVDLNLHPWGGGWSNNTVNKITTSWYNTSVVPQKGEEMLNILLVKPSQKASYGRIKPPAQIPLGLAYIGSVLEKENNVDMLDVDLENFDLSDFAVIAKRKNYDVAGFTVTTPTFFSSIELAQQIKRCSPRTLIVFGGIHPTVKPRETLNFDCVDVVIKGEGERTVREMVENLNGGRDLSNVNGLA